MNICGEIGGEFWTDSGNVIKTIIENFIEDTAYLLSGRTALDFIIRDIQKTKPIKSILMPSYCCESMLEPFFKHNIKVGFYCVTPNGINYDFSNSYDSVLVMDYFGFTSPQMIQIAQREFKNGKTVIYDSTHKLFGNELLKNHSHYSVLSYRKWLYCNFAVAVKNYGKFEVLKPIDLNYEYVELRDLASQLKQKYITENAGNKDEFLSLYSKAQKILKTNYANFRGLPVNIDFEIICEKRKANALQLVEGLSDVNGIRLLNSVIGQDDVPLFVPILVASEMRAGLHKYLVSKNIYCPLHWPISDMHFLNDEEKLIYNSEISLVCDQRYSKEDMAREISEIKKFLNS